MQPFNEATAKCWLSRTHNRKVEMLWKSDRDTCIKGADFILTKIVAYDLEAKTVLGTDELSVWLKKVVPILT